MKGSQCSRPGQVGLARGGEDLDIFLEVINGVQDSASAWFQIPGWFMSEFRHGFKSGAIIVERGITRRLQFNGKNFSLFACWAGGTGEGSGGLRLVCWEVSTVFRTAVRHGFKTRGSKYPNFGTFG